MKSSRLVRRWSFGVALAAASVAVGVPTASANLDPWTAMPAAPRAASTAVSVPLGLLRALPPEDQAAVRGEAPIGGYAPSPEPRAPRVSAPDGTGASVRAQPLGRGFDWGDAGIGAGCTAGLMLLAGGAAAAARRSGRSIPATD